MVRANQTHAPKPLELGAKLLCKWRDQGTKSVEVIERKQNEDTGEWQYYVHYEGNNRRLDEWVPLERFDLGSVSEEGKLTRTSKRKHEAEEHEEEGELDHATLKEHEEATKVKNINRVVMGQWQMETWYFSPLGKEYDGTDVLYVCEFDLNFFARRDQLQRYLSTKCKLFHPPGDEIYREKKGDRYVSVFEVDPSDQRIYCENLCLLAKLFLDHKTLYYDVDPFLFCAPHAERARALARRAPRAPPSLLSAASQPGSSLPQTCSLSGTTPAATTSDTSQRRSTRRRTTTSHAF